MYDDGTWCLFQLCVGFEYSQFNWHIGVCMRAWKTLHNVPFDQVSEEGKKVRDLQLPTSSKLPKSATQFDF